MKSRLASPLFLYLLQVVVRCAVGESTGAPTTSESMDATTAMLVGIGIGGVAVLVLVLIFVVAFCIWIRKKRKARLAGRADSNSNSKGISPGVEAKKFGPGEQKLDAVEAEPTVDM
ncbi:unnamed protein product, partial [Mesorhabditis spiculigera]